MHKYAQSMVDTILDRQKSAWLNGSRPSVEDLLHDSALPGEPEILLDLIYNEIVIREELGESPSLEEYIQRYPHLDEDLKLHFEVHGAIHENLLLDTRRTDDGGTLDDLDVCVDLGPRLAGYEIVGELGHGGMGIVYKARHRRLKRLVALKMFQPGRQPSPRELMRFRTEAEMVARLQHPNIVQIFEVGEENGKPFLALELAEKGTLAQKLRDLPFTPRAAAELIATLARAIQHAHEEQVVHRDLKPANVLFAKDGTPKITDFGLAKSLQEDPERDATRTGEPIGTPRYMAPEQAAGKPDQIGPATDVYALGTVLYECLTGQVPFVSSSVLATMEKIRKDEPLSPRRLQPSIPRDLETICMHCLYKQPARRYHSALALADDLQRFLRGEPIQARPTPMWERAWKWTRRHPALTALGAMGFLLVVTALVFFVVREHRLARLRDEVISLVNEGKADLDRQDEDAAKKKFLAALAKIKAEPALQNFELGISGWLDHSLREAEKQHWKHRPGRPLFDELRDDAFVQCVLLDPRQPQAVQSARQAINAALKLTIADDPVFRRDREPLLLLEADLLLREGEPAKSLELLDRTQGISSRLWHQRRADCLDRLDRKAEAEGERTQAQTFAPRNTLETFLGGIASIHRQDLNGAVGEFDKILVKEPEHFLSRFLQGGCLLRLNRPGEAKVALTACLGQRPRFVWSHLLRGQAYLQLEEYVAAAHDFQQAIEFNNKEAARPHIEQAIDALCKGVAALPIDRQKVFWDEKIQTEMGLQSLRDLPAFRR